MKTLLIVWLIMLFTAICVLTYRCSALDDRISQLQQEVNQHTNAIHRLLNEARNAQLH